MSTQPLKKALEVVDELHDGRGHRKVKLREGYVAVGRHFFVPSFGEKDAKAAASTCGGLLVSPEEFRGNTRFAIMDSKGSVEWCIWVEDEDLEEMAHVLLLHLARKRREASPS